MKETRVEVTRKPDQRKVWAYGLFWSWNIIFLAFMAFGFAPRMLPEMLVAVRDGVIPASFPLYAALLTTVPVVAVILGLTVLRREPGRLFAMGYAVEGPLMLMLFVRFFILREATAAVVLLLALASLGMAAFLWQLLNRKMEPGRLWLAYLRFLGLTLFLIIALYASLWLAFYAVPLAVAAGNFLWDTLLNLGQALRDLSSSLLDLLSEGWRWIPFWFLGFLLLIYTGTLFVLLPVAVPFMAARAWLSSLRRLAAAYGRARPAALTAASLALFALVFLLAFLQPQGRAFALLEIPPASPQEAQSLLAREETIRAGLLNAYLAPLRYISAVGEVYHVREIYESTLGLSRKSSAAVQQAYETVAQPMLYIPVHRPNTKAWAVNRALSEEPVEAAKLYQQFFDRPIIEGEREKIVRAVRSTWSISQAEAAWQAVDDREIFLERQEVTIQEHGDWAEVELYEVYRNQTAERQEVVYYFSLPESAVITGLWLGNSPDRAERFAYRVSPRGAAQGLYRQEVRRNVDPALVEQIGPRQYRLRIFPVEPERWEWDAASERTIVEDAPPLHMWLTYQTLVQAGGWPMPQLAEKRNVFWDGDSARLVNGERLEADEETWLPATIPATSPVTPAEHRIDFENGVTVLARPVSEQDLPRPAGGLRLAVVLDRSRSMEEWRAEVGNALAQLKEAAGSSAPVDVYLTSSPYRGEDPQRVSLEELDLQSILYYGGQNAAELLAQFESLRTGQQYDAIFVLTDSSGYEVGQSKVEVSIPDAPVWMVHLGGGFPLGYDDDTLEAIQASGGGVAGSLEEALVRLAVAQGDFDLAGVPEEAQVDVIDGYAWFTIPPGRLATGSGEVAALTAQTGSSETGFEPLAARRWILAEMQRKNGDHDRLETLDALHAIAVEQHVVTPYSSMIVLVNLQQHNMLDHLEARGDRYQREYEQVGETVPASPFAVTGVPEPEEWLLLGLAAAMLAWWYLKSTRRMPRFG